MKLNLRPKRKEVKTMNNKTILLLDRRTKARVEVLDKIEKSCKHRMAGWQHSTHINYQICDIYQANIRNLNQNWKKYTFPYGSETRGEI